MPLYPFLVLEVGSGPQVPTFRNSTYSDPQVGLTRDLGARHHEHTYLAYGLFDRHSIHAQIEA
jgi:hypothetical protein